MRAGKLRHRVLIQDCSETFVSGQRKVLWTDRGIYWADVRMKSSNEPNQDQSTKAVVTYEVILRYQVISNTSRLVWNGSILNLAGTPIEDPRKTSITVTCISSDDEHLVFDEVSEGGVIAGGESV